MKLIFSLSVVVLILSLPSAPLMTAERSDDVETLKELTEIRIRDPFVLPDPTTKTYYMYAQMDNRLGKQDQAKGVEVYSSKDLQRWTGPTPVFTVPTEFWANLMVWAPEVHRHDNKFYLFVTFTARESLPPIKGRRPLNKRGTQILVAESPEGPFRPFQNRAHTPADWMALDGTLWIEDGIPWMVFCHEWVQITNGTMELVRLRDDYSDTVGDCETLFRATDAPWVRALGQPGNEQYGFVTDGPFLYRTHTGRLLMIWSSFGTQRYAVGLAISESGKVTGPWRQIDSPLFAADGGHGMIFKTFDGKLMLAIHQPNSGNKERARFFELLDTGDTLKIK
jgi:beta-xylosidase